MTKSSKKSVKRPTPNATRPPGCCPTGKSGSLPQPAPRENGAGRPASTNDSCSGNVSDNPSDKKSTKLPPVTSQSMRDYLLQGPECGGTLYGRLIDRPQASSPYDRVAVYIVRAAQAIDKFDDAFDTH